MNLLEQILVANRWRVRILEEPNGRGNRPEEENQHQPHPQAKDKVKRVVKEEGKKEPATKVTYGEATTTTAETASWTPASTANCFICCTGTGSTSRRSRRFELQSEHYSFFLKILLEVPDLQLNAYLGEGEMDKPDTWIGLCRPCQNLIVQGHQLKEDIIQLELQLKRCQRKIVETMRLKMNSSSDSNSPSAPKIGHRGTLKIKEFVASRKYLVLGLDDQEPDPDSDGSNEESKVGEVSPPKLSVEAPPESDVQVEADLSYDGDDFVQSSSSPEPVTPGECDNDPDWDRNQDDQDEYSNQEPHLLEAIPSQDKNINIDTDHHLPTTPSAPEGHCLVEAISESMNAELERKLGPRKRPDRHKKKKKRLPATEAGSVEEPVGAPTRKRKRASYHPFSKYLYDCPSCPQIKGYTMRKYALHLANHQRRPFQCVTCMEFHPADEAAQEHHWQNHHANLHHPPDQPKFIQIKFQPGSIWKCEKCLKGFHSEEDRDKHELRCISAKVHRQRNKIPPELRKPHSCHPCQLSFRHFSELRFHRCLHHPEVDLMSCYFCDASFSEMTAEGMEARHEQKMMEHMAKEHRGKEFGTIMISLECPPCGLVFDKEWIHKTHMVKNHGMNVSKTLPCPICPKMYSNVLARREHLTLHHFQSETTMCDLCGQSFVRRSNLAHHKLHRHDIEPEDFEVLSCPKEGCSYRGVVKECLSGHINAVHKGEETRPYICTYCGKSFKDLKTSVDHEEIHKNKETRPYKCDICGNSFAVKKYLYIHKRLSHEGRFFPSSGRKRIAAFASNSKGAGGRKRGPQAKRKCTEADPSSFGNGMEPTGDNADFDIGTTEPSIS